MGDSSFCAGCIPAWKIDHGFHRTHPLHVSRPCTDGWWEGLNVGGRVACPESPSPFSLWGTLLSAHTSTQQHRCCCIVWSTKAWISPTGSSYSLAIVSVCLTRPLMNAAVSRRSDARQREQKTNQSLHTVQKIKPLCSTCSNDHCRFHIFKLESIIGIGYIFTQQTC